MNNIWRFYEETNGISGICLGSTKDEALYNASFYLRVQFDDIKNISDLEISLWPVTHDDDYREDFPYAVAIAY